MARKSKIPRLRAGLTVNQLIKGCWINESGRYVSEGELDYSIDVVRAAVQGLIDAADGGERVTRRAVINTLSAISTMTMAMKDTILKKMNNGEITPDLLDELASV